MQTDSKALLLHEGPDIHGTLAPGGKGADVSQYAEMKKVYTREEVAAFGNLVGDHNPLHFCSDYETVRASISEFETLEKIGIVKKQEEKPEMTEALVHGMLVASLFTCIMGTLLPGAVYRSQSVQFRAPVFANEEVVGRVEVTQVKESTKLKGIILQVDTTVTNTSSGKVCVQGDASFWLPAGEVVQK